MSTESSAKLRVAIVGAGYVASHHLAALKRLDFVELVGICDPNLEAANAMAARFGIGLVAQDLGRSCVRTAERRARADAAGLARTAGDRSTFDGLRRAGRKADGRHGRRMPGDDRQGA